MTSPFPWTQKYQNRNVIGLYDCNGVFIATVIGHDNADLIVHLTRELQGRLRTIHSDKQRVRIRELVEQGRPL